MPNIGLNTQSDRRRDACSSWIVDKKSKIADSGLLAENDYD